MEGLFGEITELVSKSVEGQGSDIASIRSLLEELVTEMKDMNSKLTAIEYNSFLNIKIMSQLLLRQEKDNVRRIECE